MYRDATTLDDIYRLALPKGSKILFGANLLGNAVSWACSLRPSPPAFPNLAGEELALIDMNDLRQLDPHMRLDRVVNSLRQAHIAAIAVLGNVPPNAITAAEENEIPLVALPPSDSLLTIERTVIRLIVDRSGYIAARGAELQRELTQIELDGGGMDAVAQRLTQFSEQPILFLKEEGTPVNAAGMDGLSERQRQRLFTSLPNPTALRSWLAAESRRETGELTGVLPLTASDSEQRFRQAVVSPVVVGDRIEGYCVLLRQGAGAGEDASTVERLTVLQGAGAAALAWSRLSAVGAAEEKMRATFLDELLATEVADEEAWVQRGRSLGFDLTKPHVAWLLKAEGIPDWAGRLRQFLAEKKDAVLLSDRTEGTLLFWPTDNPKSGRSFKPVAHQLVEHFSGQFPKSVLVIGIGRPGSTVRDWLHSLEQARESWRMGHSWQAAPVTYFGDLGLYQLLTALGGNREAARFFRKTIQPLIEHDENRNAELVETLEAFFACHGNLSQTAALLHIHRNTLTYRLERVSNITRLDLNDPDARFSLQLGLKLRPVMRSRPG